MNTSYIKVIAGIALATSLASCGDKFLETDMFGKIDSEIALDNVSTVGYALNGAYYNLGYYEFAGTESTVFGDLASDISYWNQETGHFNDIYSFTPSETSVILLDVWEYGYKVIDNATRVIEGAEKLYAEASEDDKALLDRYMAEAYALRAYASLNLVNIFAHQVKVEGQDFSSMPGIVIVKSAVGQDQKVSRSTIGETYAYIESDLNSSLQHFAAAEFAPEEDVYFTPKAVKGLQARVYLYQEKWQDACDAAKDALELGNISSLVSTPSAYKALYNGGASNTESFFYLAINSTDNWSANSMGTLWSSYGYSPSPWLQSIMADDDCRRAVWGWTSDNPQIPKFNGGKFTGLSGNPAFGTCYLINAPEMYLIEAEAKAKLGDAAGAATALYEVAKRNPAIASVSDLPADAAGVLAFIKDERARELFQEGLRLYDLRRWGGNVNVNADQAPNISWLIKDYNISDAVYPIPDREVNTGMGVTQNEGWLSTFPSI